MQIDIGNRMAELLQALASKIGTTADRVFPWYIKQQVIEAKAAIIIIIMIFIASLLGICFSFKKADFDEGNRYCVILAISGFAFVVCLIIAAAGGTQIITQLMNPEYHAFHKLTRDLGRLLK